MIITRLNFPSFAADVLVAIGLCFGFSTISLSADPPATQKNEDAVLTPRLPRDNLLWYRDESNRAQPVRTTNDWLKRRQEILASMQAVMGKLPGREKRVPPT